jgi:hypothetical protein
MAIGKSDGADPTRGTGARAGEPYGELGLIEQSDSDAGAQNGSPRDPKLGNMAGTSDKGSLGLSVVPTTVAVISAASIAPATITAPVFRLVFSPIAPRIRFVGLPALPIRPVF